MQRKHWKRAWSAAVAGLLASALPGGALLAQDTGMLTVPSGLQGDLQLDSIPLQFVQSAHFAIPFEVDRAGRLPSEVNLWVSADRGRSWLKYATNSPDKRSFEFHAAAEGEYLFAVQTRDDRGTSALAAAPPMRIQVDTTRPQVELTADLNSSGRLVISYKIAEEHLADDAVKLEYALDGQNKWEEIRPGTLRREGQLWTSSLEIEMPRCRELDLRISVTDSAQNTTLSIARYNAPRTASAGTGMQLASQRAAVKPQQLGQPKAAQPAQQAQAQEVNRIQPIDGSVTWEPSRNKANSRNPKESSRSWTRQGSDAPRVVDQEPNAGASGYGKSPNAGASGYGKIGQTVSAQQPGLELSEEEPTIAADISTAVTSEELPLPVAEEDRATGKPVFTQDSPTSKSPAKPALPVDDLPRFGQSESPALNSIIEKLNSATPTVTPEPPAYNPPVNAVAPGNIAIEKQVGLPPAASPGLTGDGLELGGAGASSNTGSSSSTSTSTSSSTSKDAFHSRSRSFSLDYSVDSLRGLAISDIELWGTTDRGNTWERWGSDPDRESPFDVQVGDDGLFGFRMVIIGQNGMVSNRPQDGDSADMWINVDTSMPTVKITRALYGEGEEAGMLVIDYTATDDNLHDRPITLSFSERPTGPWTTIATGLRNTGIYLWKADPKLPEQVYVRMQAVDKAGNQQEHRLELPINLRGLTPRGRIQGFRPIDTAK